MTSMVLMDSTLESLTPSVNTLLQCYMQGVLGSCDLNSNQHPFLCNQGTTTQLWNYPLVRTRTKSRTAENKSWT